MEKVKTPWGEIGYIVYKRTYARPTKEKETEEFEQTVDRCVQASVKQLKVPFSNEEQSRLKDIVLGLKGTFAGRFFWQLGTKTVDRLGLLSLQNCAAVVVNEPISPFLWTFDALMLGSGVGYNIQREYVYEIPKVKRKKVKIVRKDTKDADFIVPDSREGWTELLKRTLEASFYTGKGFSYSTVCIRGKGEPIVGFGGVASGPNELCYGIEKINEVLNSRSGKKLRPIDCLDIMNIIGYIVVSGNVRRSAQIAIGDYDDLQFLNAKRWDLGNIPAWRAMSNNSVVCNDFSKLPDQFWEGYKGNGEPYGLINLNLSRKVGRLGETEYPDADVVAYNPCAEQSLNNKETCVTGDTLIQTESGVIRIKEVVGKKVKIFNGDQWSEVKPFLVNPKDEFLKITFSDGSFLKATKYHEFSVSTPTNKKVFKKLRADELEVGMYLPKFELDEVKGVSTEYAYTLGAFTGDGYLDNGYPMLCAVEGVKDILFSNCKISSENRMWKGENRVNYMYRARIYTKDFEDNTLWKDLRDSSKGLPNYIMSLDRKSSLDFIAGWIDTDGSIRNKATKGEGFAIFGSEYKIRDAQLLCRRAGINYASVWRMSKAGSETNYGIRNRDIYVLQIPSFECGYINTRLKKISNISERYKVNNAYPTGKRIDTAPRQQITGIEILTDTEASYCFSEPLKNMGVFGNVLTYQCCLAELHLPNIDTEEELFEVAQYLYRVNKHSLALNCHHKDTEAVVHKNMRMGIGVTGYLQATEEQRSWLPNCYTKLREFDKEYSVKHGFPTSIKLTTVKPSGTLSLLSGVTSGGHPAFSRYYIRRVRISSNSELVEVCRKAGYHVEWVRNFDGTEDKNTVVIEFPCRVPDHAVLAEEIGAVKQMEVVKRLQSEWSDNAVSVTVYYKQEELDEIRAWLADNFNDGVKTISFLLHSDHGFDQAPMEAISKERYEELKAKVKPIESVSFEEDDISSDQIGCVGGVCPIK